MLLLKCNFDTVMKCNVNIRYVGYLIGDPGEGPSTSKGVVTHMLRTVGLDLHIHVQFFMSINSLSTSAGNGGAVEEMVTPAPASLDLATQSGHSPDECDQPLLPQSSELNPTSLLW